jgi:phenylpyruvate tautomerase PptA (4-oxalocrotonate tautomerase family)
MDENERILSTYSSESIKEFEKEKEILLRNRDSAIERVKRAKEKYEKIKSDDSIDKKEQRLEVAKNIIQRKEYALEQINNKLEFLRPSTNEDMEYRLKQYNEFSKQVKLEVPDNLHLCFHGCPIYAARNIIKDGEISSSVDRVGIETSYDTSDQVSVTTKNTIETTVQSYTGLAGDYNFPAGCIFAILPKDENEIKTSEKNMLISNVSFKENPERLYSIITTPENIESVTKWAEKANIDLSKIHDFEGFIQEIRKQKKQFLAQEIGKATVDTPTVNKDKASIQVHQEEIELQQDGEKEKI